MPGGLIGAELAAYRLAPTHLRKALAVMLAVAGARMIAAAWIQMPTKCSVVSFLCSLWHFIAHGTVSG
jgi:hypothetical protein